MSYFLSTELFIAGPYNEDTAIGLRRKLSRRLIPSRVSQSEPGMSARLSAESWRCNVCLRLLQNGKCPSCEKQPIVRIRPHAKQL